jgi:hypothetical protein
MIFYTSNFGYTTDPFSIEKVLFLENNFWNENRRQIKTDEGYLVYVSVDLTEIEDNFRCKKLFPMHSFYDRGKKKYLSFLCVYHVERIISALKSYDDKQLRCRLKYCFSDFELNFPIDFRYLDMSHEPFDEKENFKIINNQVGDIIKFEEFGPDSYLVRVKERLNDIFIRKYVILENFESVLDYNFECHNHESKLYYFDSISSCLKNFKAFVSFLNILKCSREDSDSINSNDNVFKISYLDYYLREKIKFDFRKKYDTDLKTQQTYEEVVSLYKRCFDKITKYLSTNILILPVRGSHTKEFYFDQFYKLIKKTIGARIEDLEELYKDHVPGYNDPYFERFASDLYNFGSTTKYESWELFKIVDYFKDLIGKEIKNLEDYIEVDKILCDFGNVMLFLDNLKRNLIRNTLLLYDKPMFIDDFDCQLVIGIEVSLESPVKFGGIKAFDSSGKKIKMERNFDYFVRVYMNKCRVSLTFRRIRERDIQEIEVISANKKYRKRFNVIEYLDKYE